MIKNTHNLEEFQKEAKKFALQLAPARSTATVVGLYGDLGAGKTTFAQAVAKALGVTETVNSPTFLIFKKYELSRTDLSPFSKGETERGWKRLIHVDAYRLKDSTELARLRFDELLADPGNLILVEWADKVTDLLPDDHVQIHLQFINHATRAITVQV
ncbi:MAG: tRNA (adenosine(37)-N6)-threonylcarbamoyltransferase complex ATPase subunit type 1 TsaE [Patescibacteria group bacterium]